MQKQSAAMCGSLTWAMVLLLSLSASLQYLSRDDLLPTHRRSFGWHHALIGSPRSNAGRPHAAAAATTADHHGKKPKGSIARCDDTQIWHKPRVQADKHASTRPRRQANGERRGRPGLSTAVAMHAPHHARSVVAFAHGLAASACCTTKATRDSAFLPTTSRASTSVDKVGHAMQATQTVVRGEGRACSGDEGKMTCRCQSFLSSSSLAKLQLGLMALQQNLVCCKPHEQPAAICIGERYRQSHKPTPGPATSRPKYPTTAVTVNARAESTVSERQCTCSCPWRSRNCLFVRVVRDCSCSQRST